jgi:ADP-ribose pyrophosphatase YjhB (NUDIX family)
MNNRDGNLQSNNINSSYFLMIQRGKPPNLGKWSIPGGRIEYGETAFQAGVRELREETRWDDPVAFQSLQWYPGTVCSSDYIGQSVHYLIAQCFAELERHDDQLPVVHGDDDADDARWFTLDEVKEWGANDKVSEGVYEVFCRMEALSKYGLLPTTETPYR